MIEIETFDKIARVVDVVVATPCSGNFPSAAVAHREYTFFFYKNRVYKNVKLRFSQNLRTS